MHRRDQTRRSIKQKCGWLASRSVQRTTPTAQQRYWWRKQPLRCSLYRPPVPTAPLGIPEEEGRAIAGAVPRRATHGAGARATRPCPVPGLAAQQRPRPPASCGSRASVGSCRVAWGTGTGRQLPQPPTPTTPDSRSDPRIMLL